MVGGLIYPFSVFPDGCIEEVLAFCNFRIRDPRYFVIAFQALFRLEKGEFRKILDPILDLVLKRVSQFVIPIFCDTLLVPIIKKCGDLLTVWW